MTEDWFEFLEALSRAGARFLVVGAHALAGHGVPRGTQDLDVWIDPDSENAERVWTALERFGAPAEALGLSLDDLSRPETVIQFGLPPNRIDLLTAVTGSRGSRMPGATARNTRYGICPSRSSADARSWPTNARPAG
jgi:hypothetical protein